MSESNPLQLEALFEGGGEPWLPLLGPVLDRNLGEAATFLGPGRSNAIVPVRELTFQALKPNPPERWRVVIFGQSPYPRLESATGIAMFDNAFADWNDAQFGKAVSMRCIIKAAGMRQHGLSRSAPVGEVRKLLAAQNVVTPPRWFHAMLAQGVLLLNASLTSSSDEAISVAAHTRFWKPVVERIVEEILRARGSQGVVFVWWGSHAKALRTRVEKLEKEVPGAAVRHVSHCNPAAMGEAFCDGDPFGAINEALRSLGLSEVDWLPTKGWDEQQGQDREEAGRLGDFIEKTRELHQLYLERLQDISGEKLETLDPIAGVMSLPLPSLSEALAPLVKSFPTLGPLVPRAQQFARKVKVRSQTLSEHEVGAIHLYTVQSVLYRQLNAVLRDPDRTKAEPWRLYLRLFLSAASKLSASAPPAGSLWRGVPKNLSREYSRGRSVTWWGVSSCTPSLAVAKSFLGTSGGRTLFEIVPISAVSIRAFSAFTGEDEYVLAPGTRLEVLQVTPGESGLFHVRLAERASDVWSIPDAGTATSQAPVVPVPEIPAMQNSPKAMGPRVALVVAVLAGAGLLLAWLLG